MSSNPTYREREREPRRERDSRGGGGYTRGRGRGGFNKPRRYWDNDDYYDKDHGGRRRHSRSRSRSRSRSYSRSISRSQSPSPRRQRRRSSAEYDSKIQGAVAGAGQELYEPYASHQQAPQAALQSVNNWKPATTAVVEGNPQTNGGGNRVPPVVSASLNSYGGGAPSLETLQRMQQTQKFQLQQHSIDDPSLTFAGYGYQASNPPPAPVAAPHLQMYSQSHPESAPGLNLGKGQQQDTSSLDSKKKKEKRKKKKSRRRSSSSSSSSSDDSSGSRRRRKSKRGRESDESSDSSSDNEEEKSQNERDKAASSSSSLTDQQRSALLSQKDGYQAKLEVLEREIGKLQTKEDELKKTRADIRLIEENLKLQAELKGRCKAVNIVLEKINDVLNVDRRTVEKPRASHPVPPPPPKIGQPVVKVEEKPVRRESISLDFEYIDNGQHWCRLCNVFPETVEKMLQHFHSQSHHDQVEQLGIDDKPWHKRNSLQDKQPNHGAKKVAFRGMQFFSPVEGWYCRLCNIWMGDPHCATDHLKSVEHNSNYMNFLDEHPEWEEKWSSDREKARIRAGLENKPESRKSRFEDRPPASAPVLDTIADDNRSIRVQMRNTIKVDENRSDFVSKPATLPKDVGIDEWMGKPQKVTLDIIDTQKFAEIVRQKHGNNKLKEEEKAHDKVSEPPSRPSPTSLQHKERERDSRRDDSDRDKRRHDRVELQISSRENRDKDRFRDNRGGRRRSRTRSRSRDRGYHSRRRSRTRSRSRDRDRKERDRGTRDRVETVKKLPMIGKMPLYKRPQNTFKDKGSEGKDSPATSTLEDSTKTHDSLKHLSHQDESNTSVPSENSMSGFGFSQGLSNSRLGFDGVSTELGVNSGLGFSGPSENRESNKFVPVDSLRSVAPDNELKPPGEKEAVGGTNLPDDLQQALDIIYKGGGKPITIPPPSMPSSIPTSVPPPSMIPTAVPPPSTTTYGDFSASSGSGYPSYMGYEPYQMSFDGYGPAGFEDMEVVTSAGNVPVDSISSVPPSEVSQAQPQTKAITEEEDDMDDLRMLGIDVDDVAVVKR